MHWLWTLPVPLFVSDRRLRRYRRLRPALAPAGIDSGAFSELQMYGSWRHGPSPQQYIDRARRYVEQLGTVDLVVQQDWPVEPVVRHGGAFGGLRFAGTGLTVRDHQRRTVANFVRLRELAPELPIVPVLQGWQPREYLNCIRLFQVAGVDLAAEPLVGVGSVCRRQTTPDIRRIVTEILDAVPTIRLHLFGVKSAGLKHVGAQAVSSDSMAWSYAARRRPPLPGCTHQHCTNCPKYALRWRASVLATAAPARRASDRHPLDQLGHR